jgi:hypothetical protein
MLYIRKYVNGLNVVYPLVANLLLLYVRNYNGCGIKDLEILYIMPDIILVQY